MPFRTVLVMPFDDPSAEATLRDGLGRDSELTIAHELPSGPGIHALVVIPAVHVNATQIAALPDLRIICTASVGLDHIDVTAAQAHGCVVANAPDYNSDEVADHTITLACALLRGIVTSDRAVRGGTWSSRASGARRVVGSTIAVIGYGSIGRRVARRALGLGMRVIATSRRAAQLASSEPSGITFTSSVGEALATADVVTLSVPLTDATRHLIDAPALESMRAGAYLVNCGRGGLVDISALDAALRSGHIAGAALDVLDHEPPAPDDPALRLPRTIITPHSAWYSPESAVAAYEIAARNIARVARELVA